ncbi:MAG: hypothetical protein PVS3B3_17090 [Ktedonobacteraceae bacterium]
MHNIVWKYTMVLIRGLWILVKVALLVIVREILTRKQVEVRTQELAKHEAQLRMNEFLSIASHELKTPLTSIKGNIQLMGRKLKPKFDTSTTQGADNTSNKHDYQTNHLLNEARELLERTDKQITQLSRLVNTLLESSRITANTMDLLLELCELDTLVHEVMQDERHIPKTRTVHVKVSSEENMLVMADVNRIKQVVIHFLSNAHKYSPLEEHIDILLETEGDRARVSVHDAGPGIPISQQNKIWERYYRVPTIDVLNGSEIGLGLGLHISHTIIKQHHGHIGVQSTPGSGSTFWFSLPLSTKDSM